MWKKWLIFLQQDGSGSTENCNSGSAKKAKWLSKEALQVAEKRRDTKRNIFQSIRGGSYMKFIFQTLNCPLKWSEVKSLSRVWLSATPWTVAYKAPLSMEFSRQEYWSRLPFPSPGDLSDPGIEPGSPTLQADTLPSKPPGNCPLGSLKCLRAIWTGFPGW